jgi:hypothetical protein
MDKAFFSQFKGKEWAAVSVECMSNDVIPNNGWY